MLNIDLGAVATRPEGELLGLSRKRGYTEFPDPSAQTAGNMG